MKKIKNITNFLTKDIWRIRTIDLPKKKKFLIDQGRIILLTFKGFNEDKCFLRASSLTFFTLLSIVPFFAMIFGVAKGFGLQSLLEKQITRAFEGIKGHEEFLQKTLEFSQNQLQNTRGGIIAGLGVVLLFYTIIKLLTNIENSLNDIWGIQKGRTISRKIADYIIVVVVAPIFLIISGSAITFISSQPEKLIMKFQSLQVFSELFILSMKFLPLLILIPLFTFIYVFMPNVKVKIKSALLAGTVSAICFIFVQILFVSIQYKLFTKYTAIYGSFAAIPMFLIWLEFSWMIVLFGAEISFATQNVETCEFESESKNARPDFKKTMAVYITSIIVERFEKGLTPLTTEEIRDEAGIPSKLAQIILNELNQAGLIARVVGKDDEKQECFQPAVPDQKLNIQFIFDKLSSVGVAEVPFKSNEKFEKIKDAIEKMEDSARKSKANLRIDSLT